MRRGGPQQRAESARGGLVYATTDEEEADALAAALAASLRLDDPPLESPAPSRGEAAGAADGDWQLVDAPASSSGGVPSAVERNQVRAREAGASAGAKLRGERAAVRRSPAPAGGWRNTRYVVAFSPYSSATGVGVGPWSDYERYVRTDEGRVHAAAVFHGFCTQNEAQAYWESIFGDAPLPTLPAWPRP